jgi:chemotaxis protein MotB
LAEKKSIIVIKKIYPPAVAAHGGSWKVAFADFMTAMMAFFLVMWLVNQPEDVKKNVADYFSTPSIVEYNFSNYGVELTLEKLFLDLVNEPLKFFQAFITPADSTPNIMAMGSKKIVMADIAEKLGDMSDDVSVTEDEVKFEIPDYYLFQAGTAEPAKGFVNVMDKVRGLTAGLENAEIYVDSLLPPEAVKGKPTLAKQVADKRLDLLSRKVEAGLESDTVDVYTKAVVEAVKTKKGQKASGMVRFRIKKKGDQHKEQNETVGNSQSAEAAKNKVYDGFVNQISKRSPSSSLEASPKSE